MSYLSSEEAWEAELLCCKACCGRGNGIHAKETWQDVICEFYGIYIHSPSNANCHHLNCSSSPLPLLSLLHRIAGDSAGEGNLCCHCPCRVLRSRKCPWHCCCYLSGATVIPSASVIARITGLVPGFPLCFINTSRVSLPPSAITQSRELLKTC